MNNESDPVTTALRNKGWVEIQTGLWEKPKARPEGIRSADEKRTEGHALERPLPGEETRGTRVTIRFTVYARRPADWDNYTVKELQDLLVMVGILDSDQWDYLEGKVTSEKVHTKAEERTEITIWQTQKTRTTTEI